MRIALDTQVNGLQDYVNLIKEYKGAPDGGRQPDDAISLLDGRFAPHVATMENIRHPNLGLTHFDGLPQFVQHLRHHVENGQTCDRILERGSHGTGTAPVHMVRSYLPTSAQNSENDCLPFFKHAQPRQAIDTLLEARQEDADKPVNKAKDDHPAQTIKERMEAHIPQDGRPRTGIKKLTRARTFYSLSIEEKRLTTAERTLKLFKELRDTLTPAT